MEKEVKMIVYVCDNCGEKLKDGDFIGYIDADIWDFCEHNWIEHEGKHYCPNCYEIDDEDNITVKKK